MHHLTPQMELCRFAYENTSEETLFDWEAIALFLGLAPNGDSLCLVLHLMAVGFNPAGDYRSCADIALEMAGLGPPHLPHGERD